MINNQRVLAIIPARSGSKGLPRKNIRAFCGKPLLVWSIEQGKACKYIDRLLVSTDSEEIADLARENGATVPFIRPADLSLDTSSTADVLLHAIDYLRSSGEVFDYLVLLEPTSPLRDITDIGGALEALVANPEAGSIVGVAKAEATHPAFLFTVQERFLRPILGNQPTGLRRQDLKDDYFFLEGSIYVSTVESFGRHKSFYHPATMAWVVDRYKAVEIDELSDFIVAEALMKAKLEGRL